MVLDRMLVIASSTITERFQICPIETAVVLTKVIGKPIMMVWIISY